MKIVLQKDKIRKIIVVLLTSILYACMYAIGSEINANRTCSMPVVIRKIVICVPLFALGLMLLLHGFQRRTENRVKEEKPFHTAWAFVLLLIPYVLYWLTVFPGHFTYDTPAQMTQIVSGEYSAHHPLIHTLLLQLFMALQHLLGSVESCAAAYIGFQIALMAFLFAKSCCSMARSFGSRAGWIACVFFALYPMNACFAAQMTKDSLFTAFLTLFFALCIEGITTGTFRGRLLVQLIVVGVFAALFRNNMIYALVVWAILLLLILRRTDKKRLLAGVLCIVALAFGSGKAMQIGLKAKPVDIREMLSWPAQQIARARFYGWDGFSGSDRDLYERFLPADHYLGYEPTCSDAVKYWIMTDIVTETPDDFLQLYLSVGRKCKQEYLDAIAELTYPLLYPYPEYNTSRAFVETGIKKESFDRFFGENSVTQITTFEKIRQWMDENIWQTGAAHIPILRWMLNLGVATWLLLFFVAREAYFGRWNRFVVQLLPLLYWGTVLLGPVMQGRYIYPIICVLPFMMCTKKKTAQEPNDSCEM